jgi:EAL domain-containing protein (putative c-di-GMP-specific phosphodiesterase class I)
VLRAHGVQILLDSFGRRVASLKHLLTMPIDGVKLDLSLVQSLRSGHATDRALLSGILGVATAQGLTVIAMGVEQDGEVRECEALGLRYFQGARFQPPLTPRQFEAALAPGSSGVRRLELVKK